MYIVKPFSESGDLSDLGVHDQDLVDLELNRARIDFERRFDLHPLVYKGASRVLTFPRCPVILVSAEVVLARTARLHSDQG